MTRRIERNPFERTIIFTKDELELIRKVAEQRQAPKDAKRSAVRDKRIIARDNVETHMIGLLGEFAIAKLINGIVDTDAYLAGDQEKDFCLYGVTIEVKTLQGYLTFKRIGDFKSDLAALVIYEKYDLSTLYVQGWITRKEFEKEFFVDDFGYGERPCVQPTQLLPIETLKTYCLVTRNQRWMMNQITAIRSEVGLRQI